MKCLRCEAENREGRRFCSACGAALAQPCPECGFANESDERFCGGCGRALREPSPGPAPERQATEPSTHEIGERRQVTVLFADISGYTSLTARHDPEETHRMLGRFFEAVDSTVTRFGGAVERHIGDNVMGVFGAPLAHDDDPRRAVQAAAEIHRVVRGVGEEVGIDLKVHIGIASGKVMASSTGSSLRAAYGVVGSPVNLAARLQGRAASGETLISDAVRSAVEDVVELEPMGDVAIKGLDVPQRVWRVVGERRVRTPEAALPLVGRRAEIKLLTSILDGAAEADHGAVVYVRGEAGIGKTRLTQFFIVMARERGFSCHAALVLDFGTGQGRDATRSLVASLIGCAAASPESQRRMAALAAVERGHAAVEDVVFLNDLLDLPQSPELRVLYDAMDNAGRNRGGQRVVTGLVRALSTTAPLLLVVEDVHWADPPTLDHLAAIAEILGECRAILVMTSRIDGDPIDAAWRARLRGGIATIDLGPLRPDEAVQFGERLRIANDPFLQRCIDRAEGNPLFLEQLLRNTQEGAEVDDVPASVQSLVLARMDRLPPRDKAGLQAASVAGQRFSLDLVRALLADPAFSPTVLLQQQMVRPEGSEFLFAHALVRDGVYSSLTHERRRTLHRAAAEFYAERDATLRAEHLERADDPRAAAAYCAAAAAEAAGYRYDRALSLAARGRVVATKPADRFALAALCGDCLREAGRTLESLEAWQAAHAEAANPLERCQALIGIAATNRILSRPQPALAALAEAQPLAETDGHALEAAQIHYYRGNLHFAQGETAACLAEHKQALAYAEQVANPEWRARALSGIGDAFYSFCRMRTALSAFQECVELCEAHGFGRVALANRVMIGHCMTYVQQVGEAVRVIEAARDAAVRIGNPHAEMFAMQSLGLVLTQAGQSDAAAPHLPAALELARTLGARRYESNILIQQAEHAMNGGRRAEALRLSQEGVAIAREVGLGFTGPYALAVLARASKEPALRAQALEEGEDLLRKGSLGHNYVWFYRVAAETEIEA
ncbi:MAG: AAA family ATPase, partial [Methylobacteriaceae bacterium]|nr:AAA family ATPase [Methylobacteriaceae bacterium]